MSKLTYLPIEITTHIFQACDDFPQVIALAATCKELHSVWDEHQSTIIWEVAGSNILCFDLALMAVRATAIVLKASQANTPPPPFPSVYALSGAVQKPSVAELKKVLDLQHLVRCVEYMYFNSTCDNQTLFGYGMLPSEFRRDGDHYDQDSNTQAEAEKIRFYRAMYQLFLAGAVLSGAYNAPFWEAAKTGRTSGIKPDLSNELNVEDQNFCRQFPVYNYDVEDYTPVGKWREKKYEDDFGPFAKWLIDKGNARESLKPEPDSTSSDEEHPDARRTENRGAVQDLMCLLVGYEHLICKFANADRKEYAFGRFPKPVFSAHSEGKSRTATIIVFGVFRVEEVTIPGNVQDTRDVYLPVTIHPSLKGTSQETFDVPSLMSILSRHSRSSTAIDNSGEHPDPPATFQFWFFALRRYLDLGFRRGAFWQWRECMWWEAVGGGVVFYRPEWAPLQPYVKGKVSWYFIEPGAED